MPDSSSKTALRVQFRQQRDDLLSSLSSRDRLLAFSVPPSPLAALMTKGKTVAGYIAMGSEADPAKLLVTAEAKGCALALPHVTSRAAPMRFLQWTSDVQLEPGPFGLLQPPADAPVAVPDVVLVPLVAFDDRMMRLGQGAGHYDRALSLLGEAIAVGIAWSVQQAERLPDDPWDIPLDAVLTERAWITA